MSKLCPFCRKRIKNEDTCPYCHRVIIEKVKNSPYQPNFTFWEEKQHKNTSAWLSKPFRLTKGWVIGGLILLAIVYLGIESDDTSQATQQLGQEVVQPSPTPIDYRELINNDNILIKINEVRLANGLPQLKMSESLKDYANARANEINLASNLTHDTKLKVKDYDNQHSEYGEILFSGAQTASQAVNGWLNSPTHRDLILRKDYETIGVTTLQNNYKLGSIVVAEFGKIYVPPPRQRIIQFPKLEFRRRITCNTTTDYFTGDIRTTCY